MRKSSSNSDLGQESAMTRASKITNNDRSIHSVRCMSRKTVFCFLTLSIFSLHNIVVLNFHIFKVYHIKIDCLVKLHIGTKAAKFTRNTVSLSSKP